MSLNKGLICHLPLNDRATDSTYLYDASAYDAHFDTGDIEQFGVSGVLDSGIEVYVRDNDSSVSGEKINGLSHEDNFTITCWLRYTNENNRIGSAIMRGHTRGSCGIQSHSLGWQVGLRFNDADSHRVFLPVDDTEWHHVVLVVEGSSQEVRGYIDGSFVDSNSWSDDSGGLDLTSWDLATTSRLTGTSSDSEARFQMEDLRFYNRAITEEEIEKLHEMRSHRVQKVQLRGMPETEVFTEVGSYTYNTKGAEKLEVLVVAGGGGGGGPNGAYGCGGGGAGGVVYRSSYDVSSLGLVDVVVGDGGINEENGEDSEFHDLTALGGGHGGGSLILPEELEGAEEGTHEGYGSDGGSGGGASAAQQTADGGAGLQPTHSATGDGSDGGDIDSSTWSQGGAGGGGAEQEGQDNNSDADGKNGGDGNSFTIDGTTYEVGGGGGGGGHSSAPEGGSGGFGGGGDGGEGSSPTEGQDGDPNTGGGGGGGGRLSGTETASGGKGGSGIVVINPIE